LIGALRRLVEWESGMGPRGVEITDEVTQVGGRGLSAAEDAAVYLIDFGGCGALVDAGCGGGEDRLLANVESTGLLAGSLEFLLITHCHYDHAGGARHLRDRLGLKVVAHELDAPYIEVGDDDVCAATWYGARQIPCPVDLRLAGGRQDLQLNGRAVTALHIPGHSPGSVAYLAESGGKKILFGQDVHGPLHPSLKSDRAAYQASLRLLLDLEADILCEGHFGVFRGKDEVRDFIRSFL
jgi:glyoxylase-like metal-dependent hydrolase (beta-lactamase superfamily II)